MYSIGIYATATNFESPVFCSPKTDFFPSVGFAWSDVKGVCQSGLRAEKIE